MKLNVSGGYREIKRIWQNQGSQVLPGREVAMCKLGVISQKRLKTEVQLLLSDNRKS